MILILTNSKDVTADYLCQNHLGESDFVRLDTDTAASKYDIVYRKNNPPLLSNGRDDFRPEQVSGVWYRRPGRVALPSNATLDKAEQKHVAREWTEALGGYLEAIPADLWLNHPRANAAASKKLQQHIFATQIGFITPATLLTNRRVDAIAFAQTHGSVIAKPLSHGVLTRNDGNSTQIYTSEVDLAALEGDLPKFTSPILFQEKVEKTADIRLTVSDNFTVAVAIRSVDSAGNQILDIRRGLDRSPEYSVLPEIPTDIATKLSTMMQAYRLRFAALDFGLDQHGNWIFFELNPNGQWAWLDMEAGTHIGGHIAGSLYTGSRLQD